MSTKANLILDLSIFAVFLVAFEPGLTGIAIHEWLSLAFIAALITHLLFHWKWIVSITTQFFRKLFHESRLNYLVDALFFIFMTAAILTGIMISQAVLPLFGINLPENSPWRSLHHLTSDGTLLMLGLHFALHWKWIVNAVSRYLVSPALSLFRRPRVSGPNANFVAVPVEIDRE